MALAAALALPVLPRRVHLSEAGAPTLGFDPAVAHLLLAAAALAVVGWYALVGRRAAPEGAVPPLASAPPGAARLALGVGLLILLLYFPPFLARYGPYGEDQYFLSALLRERVGQRPYLDFEFIYGPLLIFPIARWFDWLGYSMHAYYWFLAVIEALTFGTAAYALARMVPAGRTRWAAIGVLLVLLINDNLGLSWIALRRLLPVAILLMHARLAPSRHGWLATGGMLGLLAVLSLEYALAVAAAIVGLAALEALAARRLQPVARAGLLLLAATGVAGAMAFALMGDGTGDWLRATWLIIALRGGGEAAFPFQVSANAVAVFGLLFLASAWLGTGLTRLPATGFESGDRFLALALAYAVVALKSGLARSDMYHLVPPVLGLVVVALVPFRFATLAPPAPQRRLALALVALVCLTYAPGLAGAGRFWARGLVLGARDVLSGRPPDGAEPAAARGPRLGAERTSQNPAWVPLAEFLASAPNAARPVFYYERTWGLDKMIGAPKPRGVYANDDYLVSDEIGLGLRRFLEDHPAALVVIDRPAWDYLQDSTAAPSYRSMFWIGRERSPAVRFLERWSSSHFGTATVDERVRKRDRWARTVGTHLVAHYAPMAEFGNWLVLARPERP